jgi:hypothetical protein
MRVVLESEGWSGEGEFTQKLLERLRGVEYIAGLKVEDAPSTRSDADYNFIANEIFVTFEARQRSESATRFWVIPTRRRVTERLLTLGGLARILEESEGIGPADYLDDGMLQYLRTERIVPPYQTKGYKLVELVRIYESKAPEAD